MSAVCSRCFELEDKQTKPGLVCSNCGCFIHLNCLQSQTTPGNFADDVFFNFCCEKCAPNQSEVLTRKKFIFTWLSVIYLTIHQLTTNSMGISNNGYFHYKTHIASFIDRNWQLLFEPHFKQKKNWIGTIAGQLSMNSGTYFRSGTLALGETGWWRLQHAFSPAVAAHISNEISRDKPKGRNRPSQPPTDRPGFLEKVTELGYAPLLRSPPPAPPSPPAVPCKRVKLEAAAGQSADCLLVPLEFDIPLKCEDGMVQIPELSEGYADYVVYAPEHAPQTGNEPAPSETSSWTSTQNNEPTVEYDFEYDNQSSSPYQPVTEYTLENEEKTVIEIKKEKKKQLDKPLPIRRENLFSTQLNSVDLPWITPLEEPKQGLVEMSEYSEIQLLKQVDGLMSRVMDPNKKADLRRLRAKLNLRRLKRHKHLPVFDFDKTVKVLSGYVTEDKQEVTNVERVLDRFQRSYLMDNLSGTVATVVSGPQIVSLVPPAPLVSPHSGAQLPPLIRRDERPRARWLDVTEELLKKANSKVASYRVPARAPLEYSYVRPQHVAAVNNLCAQFFWPGIDLSEALEYPEFSCVVTYRRLVVGCAFLVPGVRLHEAYISFIVVRPEWQNAKIATFMLYHLLQTCTGQDVTLHVSPTNPAIFLYQKFGFKVEELVQDFYEKYYDVDYKGCRHALFLRLRR